MEEEEKKILEEVWRLMIPFHLHWHRTLLCTYLIINMKNLLSFCDFHADIWFELRKFNAKQGDRFLKK